jgi:hypothetical protein
MSKQSSSKKKKGGASKVGRNKVKSERYRREIGKPRGPGVPGNKSGRNKT